MRTGRARGLLHSVGAAALAGCLVASGPIAALAQAPTPTNVPASTPASARQGREMSFAVPLIYDQRALGDVVVKIPANGAASYEAQSMRRELGALLNDAGKLALDEAIGGQAFIDDAVLAQIGAMVRFDSNQLEVVIESLDGRYRPVGTLGVQTSRREHFDLPVIEPAEFSAYLNINGNLDYDDLEGLQKPELYLFGASRYKDVVIELDGAVSDQFGPDYRFYRRSLRAIYDMPGEFRRVTAGDLQPDTVPLLPSPAIAGVSVERRRRTFQPFLPASRLGGREIYLDTDSTVDVLINGVEHETLNLDAGRYDLANLPLQFGSNNVQLRIRDAAGREQTVDYDYFFEPLDLEVGDYEYVASVGLLATSLSYQPEYSDKLAAVGYYRRAFTESLILGGGVQLSKDRQIFAAETTVVPQVFPGVFDLQGAVSTGDGTGYAVRAGYRWRDGGDNDGGRQLNLTLDYQSSGYQTLDNSYTTPFSTLSVSASLTQAFSNDTFGTAGVSYTRQGGARSKQTLAYAEVAHRLDNRFRILAGVEYGDDPFYRRNVGVRLGISMLFGGGHRANADYRSRTGTFRGTVSRGAEDHVGSWGYDAGVSDARGDTSADASLDYVGNRFDARATVFTRGRGIGDVTDRQRARLQVGTALAYADGAFGIGRPVSDSFAVLEPHPAIKDRDVITGRSLRNDKYDARSGLFGAAVQGGISSYSPENLQFDLAGLGTGYDIGDGLARVDPPLHSGYKIVVGSNRYVSAVGNLVIDGQPLALASGTLSSVDDEGFETQPFFTNSAGRFGVFGLAPGKTYLVTLTGSARTLRIEVPESNDGLYRIGTVELPPKSE
jgi:outer membrane usher protein